MRFKLGGKAKEFADVAEDLPDKWDERLLNGVFFHESITWFFN